MENVKDTRIRLNPFGVAVVPKILLRKFLVKKSFSCVFCFILAIVMIVPLTVLPGLILLVAPAEIAVLGKIHDEVQLMQWVRQHTIVREGRWEEAEAEKDRAFAKSPERRDSTVGYTR